MVGLKWKFGGNFMKFIFIILFLISLSYAYYMDYISIKLVNNECIEMKQFDKDSLKFDLLYRLAYVKSSDAHSMILLDKTTKKEKLYFTTMMDCLFFLKNK